TDQQETLTLDIRVVQQREHVHDLVVAGGITATQLHALNQTVKRSVTGIGVVVLTQARTRRSLLGSVNNGPRDQSVNSLSRAPSTLADQLRHQVNTLTGLKLVKAVNFKMPGRPLGDLHLDVLQLGPVGGTDRTVRRDVTLVLH